MPEEMFEVIDEKGNVIGLKARSEVHARGLRHRGIYLVIFNGEGKIFIQQRAENKDLMPSKWDFSIAEHLQPGESYKSATLRGAEEELSIKVRNLKLVGEIDWKYKYESGLIDNELNQLFAAEFDGSEKDIKFGDGEVQQGKWVELRKLLDEMNEQREKFTPWFLNCKKQLEELVIE